MQILLHCKTTLHVSGVTAPSSGVLKTVPEAVGTVFNTPDEGAVTSETCRIVLQ